jgi:hypothetical protein
MGLLRAPGRPSFLVQILLAAMVQVLQKQLDDSSGP